MNESEKQFSFTRTASSTSGRAQNQIPISKPDALADRATLPDSEPWGQSDRQRCPVNINWKKVTAPTQLGGRSFLPLLVQKPFDAERVSRMVCLCSRDCPNF